MAMPTTSTTVNTTVDSPVGELTLVADDGRLTGVYFPHHWYRPDAATFGRPSEAGFDEARRQLAEYFAGDREHFDLPLDARGDEFQRRVWDRIARIPYGQTVTYGELARELGSQVLARDVGAAVGRNPLSVIVPCHRVVGKDGKLTGYAGGLARKRLLLDLDEPAGRSAARLCGPSSSRSTDRERLPHVTGKQPFEAFVARHGATVLRVCRAVLGPRGADDAWSETFLAALKAYPGLPGDANVEAWLVTIAHRKAIDVTRAAARRAVPVADVPESPSARGADERDLDLSAALAALPRKQREAVAYHYLGGLPYHDVAAIAGGSTDAARRAAADGIAALRESYAAAADLEGEGR